MVDVENFASSAGIFIVHFGDPRRTYGALASCRLLEDSPGGLWVIDNSSNFPCEVGPGVQVIRPGRNLGYAGAVNRAVEVARDAGFSHAWILNNDVTVASDSLTHFAEAFERFQDADIVGSYVANGSLCYFGGGGFGWRLGRPWHEQSSAPTDTLPTGGIVETGWINGASMMIPVASFNRRGTFDEHFFLYKEELEWQIRSPRARAIMVERFLVDHEVGATTGSTMSVLGAAFMARNGLLIAGRRRGVSRVAWTLEVVWANIVHPLMARRFRQLSGALIGIWSLEASPEEVIRRVSRLPNPPW